jgi:hypothetical protein
MTYYDFLKFKLMLPNNFRVLTLRFDEVILFIFTYSFILFGFKPGADPVPELTDA